MKREFSAGGIVFNTQGQVLLVQSSSTKAWQFPKGLIDEGQSSQQTAVREVKEEGGVEAEAMRKVGDSRYVYTHPATKERTFKVVTFYLMKYLSGDPQDHDWEISEAGWFTFDEAVKKLAYSDQKKFLRQAMEMWNEKN